MEITAAMVAKFRAKTGLSMMDCKNALVATNGDEDKALEWLRQQGKGRIEKAADREASQGRIAIFADAAAGKGGIIEMRCETAPVANTDDFIRLCNLTAKAVALSEAPTAENIVSAPSPNDPSRTIKDEIEHVFNRLRENMQVKRVAKLTGAVGSYVHFNGQSGTLVAMSAPCDESVKTDVCMHITAIKPKVTRREDVDPATIEKEKAAFAEEAKGKPPQVVEKIVSGKLDRWFSEFVLLEQPFVKDDKQSVSAFLNQVAKGLTVRRFLRYEVGVG